MRDNPQGFTTPAPRLGAGAWDVDDERAGHIGEQPFMTDGTRLDDMVGYDWAIVATAEAAAVLAGIEGLPTVVAVDSESGQNWLARNGSVALLVRPDRYVAALASTLDDLGSITGRGGHASH